MPFTAQDTGWELEYGEEEGPETEVQPAGPQEDSVRSCVGIGRQGKECREFARSMQSSRALSLLLILGVCGSICKVTFHVGNMVGYYCKSIIFRK